MKFRGGVKLKKVEWNRLHFKIEGKIIKQRLGFQKQFDILVKPCAIFRAIDAEEAAEAVRGSRSVLAAADPETAESWADLSVGLLGPAARQPLLAIASGEVEATAIARAAARPA